MAEESSQVTYTSVADAGISSDRNAKFRRFMEDSHAIADKLCGDEKQGLFCVFDGHGGRTCAHWLRDHFVEHMEKAVSDLGDEATPEEVVEAQKAAYASADAQIKEDKVPIGSGACAVTALIRETQGKRYLYTANAGDARAILCRDGKAVRLTYDHKCEDEQEAARIKESGGFIVNKRVNGMVAITRALGDHCMKSYIISEPYTVATELQKEDDLLILACDGVWDVIEDQAAVDLIKDMKLVTPMSKKLLISTLKAGSTDNVSVMVIKLRPWEE